MELLEVSGLSKSFGTAKAVEGASLAAGSGDLVCLLGPSGCGKTTLLRLIAGLEEPDEGTVTFDGRSLERVPPQSRGFGLMFQDLALFPHMDVFGNVAFGLRMQRLTRERVRDRVHELLELVEMPGFAQRKVHELSGGERQRVALARSLAPAPRLLMLDEPLGSLDRVLRDSLQAQVRGILKEVGVTSIYVTHDRDEAFAMADKLVFMDQGRIVQSGAPDEVFGAPSNEFVAGFLGFKNILRGSATARGDSFEVVSAIGPLLAHDSPEPVGGQVTVIVEERGITVRPAPYDGPPASNVLSAVVVERAFRGGELEVKVRVGDGKLSCLVSPDPFTRGLLAGDEVTVSIRPEAVRLLGNARG